MIYLRVFSGLVLFTSLNHRAWSQNWCATELPASKWERTFGELNTSRIAAHHSASALTVIPVIFHIIHSGQSSGTYPNLSALQIQSQMQVLNEDYSGYGYNWGTYPVNAFKNYATANGFPSTSLDALGRLKMADTGIQFCLATKDTLGNTLAEAGVERLYYQAKGWRNPSSIIYETDFSNFLQDTVKPQSIWNPTKYLNIWISDRSQSVGVNGFGMYPLFSGIPDLTFTISPLTDGVWCYAKSVGSIDLYPSGQYLSNKNKGRTCSHEIGHYFGLRHIWGDSICGNDHCDDTPRAAGSHSAALIYPGNAGSCTGNSPDGEMYMNIMDYTTDAERYMFTPGQVARMQTALANSPYRKFLGTHALCSPASATVNADFSITGNICALNQPQFIINRSRGVPAPVFSWTATPGATVVQGTGNTPASIQFPIQGVYSITLLASNGATSSITKTVQVYGSPQISLTPSSTVICAGEELTVFAPGSLSYTWMPGLFSGSAITVSGIGLSNFTIMTEGLGGCLASKQFSLSAVDCTGFGKSNQQGAVIFPNPFIDCITILMVNRDVTFSIALYDYKGELIAIENRNIKEKIDLHVPPCYPPGMYLLRINRPGSDFSMKMIKLDN
jgi:hypothetical protein